MRALLQMMRSRYRVSDATAMVLPTNPLETEAGLSIQTEDGQVLQVG